ncbi:mobilisation protein (MobC) [Lachnospiraceae bacterium C7]|nr:mobilisation protein (MobC) [Lachnospiraceae bacterium C7]
MSSYIRKIAINGYLISLDLSDLKEIRRLLSISSNNLNQYAKRANETGSIYKTDIEELKKQQDELWEMLREIMSRLASIE